MEELKQRLRAKRTKIKRYEQRIGLYRQNGLFTTEQKSLHRELSGEFGEDIIPDAEDSNKFWRGIWSVEKGQRQDAEWLNQVRQTVNARGQERLTITKATVGRQCKKIPKWKAPGRHGVQGFWIKKLDTMHEQISRQLNGFLNYGNALPVWMTYGRTVLCLKDPSKGYRVDNYRHISCLPLMWKLMTGIMLTKY